MDLNEFRCFISESGLDIWTWIDMAISLACVDHQNVLKNRRDSIVQKLYAPPLIPRCKNCREDQNFKPKHDVGSDHNPEILKSGKEKAQIDEDDDDDDDEQREILEIKTLLDDQHQSERSLIELLERLVDMDTTFKALKETDIGRHVTKLRKHSSNEIRRLVKILVRKWKDIVDEWVRLNTPTEEATRLNGDEKPPNEAHQDKGKVKHYQIESEKLDSPAKRFHDDQNYQETQHAKKHRTSQEIDFHNIPRKKNAIFTNNGGTCPLKYW